MRGVHPENTLPSFEAALDACVTSIETDLHLTRDGVVMLCHEPVLSEHWCRVKEPTRITLAARPPICSLPLDDLRLVVADRNPDPSRFPDQTSAVTPLAALMADEWMIDPYAIPTLGDLIAFAAAYAGLPGQRAGKTPEQREAAAGVRFDLELKRVPLFPESIGDDYRGIELGLLEKNVLREIRTRGVLERTTVRSFDHRCVAALLRGAAAHRRDPDCRDPTAAAERPGPRCRGQHVLSELCVL